MRKIGLARIVDCNDDKTTCMVRLLDEDGLPKGRILTGVKYMPNAVPERIKPLPVLPEKELNTIAGQNVLYNSYIDVEIT